MGEKLDRAVDKLQQTDYTHPYTRDAEDDDLELRRDPLVNGPFLDEVQEGHDNARRKGDALPHLFKEGDKEQEFRARETKGDRDAADPEVRREAQKKADAEAKKNAKKDQSDDEKDADKKAPGKK